jgi:hypothetical protein
MSSPGTLLLDAAAAALLLVLISCPNPPDEPPDTAPVSHPRITVSDSGVQLAASGSLLDFGCMLLSDPVRSIEVTLENTGDADLQLTGTPPVGLSGTQASSFALSSQPTATLSAGTRSSFIIRFAPQSAGDAAACVAFNCNDPDQARWSIALCGTATELPAPEMNLKGPSGAALADGKDGYSFGATEVATSSVAVFTVENVGTGPLNLTGTPRVGITGANADQFSVTAMPDVTTAAGANTHFTVRFNPTSRGVKRAAVSIASDDGDENPYDFSVDGTGTVPEINVKQGSTDIPTSTGSYAFVSTAVGSSTDVVFTIENLGDAALSLMGAPTVSIGGADPAMFTVIGYPYSPVAAGGSRTFTVRFAPTTMGMRHATLLIVNSDADENPYSFALSGEGLVPEMNVRQGTTSIADGSGSFTFTSTNVGSSTSVSFTIQNLGGSALLLSGSPRVAVGGPCAAEFTVTTQPTNVLGAGLSTSFSVRFTPTAYGTRNASLSIANSDADENPYNFSISGTGLASEMDTLAPGNVSIPDGSGAYTFAATPVGASSDAVFTIQNPGTLPLDLVSSPRVIIGGSYSALLHHRSTDIARARWGERHLYRALQPHIRRHENCNRADRQFRWQ